MLGFLPCINLNAHPTYSKPMSPSQNAQQRITKRFMTTNKLQAYLQTCLPMDKPVSHITHTVFSVGTCVILWAGVTRVFNTARLSLIATSTFNGNCDLVTYSI